MIAPPAGWTVTPCEGGLALVPAGGPALGVFRYLERLRPVRPVSALVADVRDPAGWHETSRTAIERLVTREGEYGAFVACTGLIDETRCERTFGFVFGDDHVARLTAICFQPDAFASFRELVRHFVVGDAQLLGVRRRRYLYQPPAGWQPLASLFHTTWIAPGHPKIPASILVMPAVPRLPGLKEGLVIDAAGIADPTDMFLEPPRELPPREGLRIDLFRLRGDISLVVLEDDRFTYAVRGDGADLAPLMALVDSIEPIPRPGEIDLPALGKTMTHWTE